MDAKKTARQVLVNVEMKRQQELLVRLVSVLERVEKLLEARR